MYTLYIHVCMPLRLLILVHTYKHTRTLTYMHIIHTNRLHIGITYGWSKTLADDRPVYVVGVFDTCWTCKKSIFLGTRTRIWTRTRTRQQYEAGIRGSTNKSIRGMKIQTYRHLNTYIYIYKHTHTHTCKTYIQENTDWIGDFRNETHNEFIQRPTKFSMFMCYKSCILYFHIWFFFSSSLKIKIFSIISDEPTSSASRQNEFEL